MITELVTSLRMNLAEELPELESVITISDGVSLTGRDKPFATVEYLFDTRTKLTSGTNHVNKTYSFQIGVFADDYMQRLSIQEAVASVLESPEGLTVYTETGTPTDTTFICDVSAFTPMYNDDTASDTNNHRGYFDVSVELLTTYGSADFTQ